MCCQVQVNAGLIFFCVHFDKRQLLAWLNAKLYQKHFPIRIILVVCVFVKLVHTTVSCKDAGSILYNENYPSPLGFVFLTTSASLGRVSACLFFWGVRHTPATHLELFLTMICFVLCS